MVNMPCDYNKSGIYYIKNIINGKHYIGSSINIKNRINQHKWLLSNNRSHSPKLQNAYNKYGIAAFCFDSIEFCEKEKLSEREKYWIVFYDSIANGYNLSFDTKVAARGIKRSKQFCENISERNRLLWSKDDGTLRKKAIENVKKATEKRKGAKNSVHHNEAIKKANKGKRMTEETKEFHRKRLLTNPINYWLGKSRSDEDRNKMSLSHLGKCGSLHPCSKKIIQMDLKENKIAEFVGIADAARILGISRTAINSNLMGRSKTCNNTIFKYATD